MTSRFRSSAGAYAMVGTKILLRAKTPIIFMFVVPAFLFGILGPAVSGLCRRGGGGRIRSALQLHGCELCGTGALPRVLGGNLGSPGCSRAAESCVPRWKAPPRLRAWLGATFGVRALRVRVPRPTDERQSGAAPARRDRARVERCRYRFPVVQHDPERVKLPKPDLPDSHRLRRARRSDRHQQ